MERAGLLAGESLAASAREEDKLRAIHRLPSAARHLAFLHARACVAALRHCYLWHEFGDLHLILP